MGASCNQFAFHQAQAIGGGENAVVRLAAFGAGLGRVGDENPVLLGILKKVSLQAALLGIRRSLHNGQIPLVHLPVFDFLVHHPQCLGGFCGNDDAAGVPVDAIAQGGGEAVLAPGAPFVLLVEVGLDMVNEGSAVFRAIVGVYGQSRPLVHQQNLVVLIHDVQLGGGHGEISIILPGLVEKFVVDIQLKHIAPFQSGVPLGSGTVELDALDTNILLCQRGREQGNGLGKKTIQPLTGIVMLDG